MGDCKYDWVGDDGGGAMWRTLRLVGFFFSMVGGKLDATGR